VAAPTDAGRTRQLVESFVRDEILYREGVALGLDRDDALVRRRVAQKVELLAEEARGRDAVGDVELQAYLDTHPARFEVEPRLSFRQAYVEPRPGRDLDRDAAHLLTRLRRGGQAIAASDFGDPTQLPRQMEGAPLSAVARDFGADFANALMKQPQGGWSGPVRSAFGLHIVVVDDRIPARTADPGRDARRGRARLGTRPARERERRLVSPAPATLHGVARAEPPGRAALKTWVLALQVLLGCWLAIAAGPVGADEFRPAYLELREAGADSYDVTWKVPARGDGERLGLYVRFPEGAVNVVEPRGLSVGSSHVERWRIRQPGGLHGRQITIDGLRESAAEVLVRIESADGSAQVVRLLPSRPSFTVAIAAGAMAVAQTYTGLGIEHILLGLDHLLFVFALLVLVRGGRRIVLTITAFTLAHSITLAAATFGWLSLPPPPVEAVIALSIAFLAREIVVSRRGRESLTERQPGSSPSSSACCTASASPERWPRSACRRRRYRSRCCASTSVSRSASCCS
jgi:hypothetical protein